MVRSRHVGQVHYQGGGAAGRLAHGGGRAVEAVVGQHDYLYHARGQGLARQRSLGGQCGQGGGQRGRLILGRDDDAGLQGS